MEKVFYTVLKMSLTGSWVILAVLLLRLLLRRAPKKCAYALWLAAAFRLLCPVSFQSALSLFNLRLGPAASPVVDLPGVTGAEYHFVRPQLTTGIPAVNAVVGGSFSSPEPVLGNSANPEQILLAVGMVLWCAGMLAMVLYAAVSYLRLRLRMRDAVIVEHGVYQSEKAASPFILGLFRPRIIVPCGLDGVALEHILAHERIHLRRLDHVVKLLAFLILTIHWFNPLVWLAFVLMSRDMELSCDEAVLRRRGDIRREYSQILLNVAAARRFPSPTPLAFGEGDVGCRIRSALRWKKPRVWITVLAVLLCIAAGIVCSADPKEKSKNEYFPFAETYRAEEVVYQSPVTSMLYRAETLPEITLTSDQVLFLRPVSTAEQTQAGAFRPAELTKADYADLFISPLDAIGTELRRQNRRVWALQGGETAHYLLEQKNGAVILVQCMGTPEDPGSALWAARLTPANRVWVSVNGGSHYDLTRVFPEQEMDLAALPVVSTGERTVLEFHLNWDCPSLLVAEEYYPYGDTAAAPHRSETTLVPGDDGVFRLPVTRRDGNSRDHALFIVRDGNIRHVLRVNFSASTVSPGWDHGSPDPEDTGKLQTGWEESRLRMTFAAHRDFKDLEILDVVPASDRAEGLAGVVQYREKGQEGCLAFIEESGIIHPTKLLEVTDIADNAMVYLGGGVVQLELFSKTHGIRCQHTVSFSRTDDGVHITAKSQPSSPVDAAMSAALKATFRSDEPTGLVSARSYAAVDTQQLQDGSVRVCAWVMYQDYAVADIIRAVNTGYGPAVLTFDRNWELTDFQMLTDSHAPGDVKDFFGTAAAGLQDPRFDAQTYREPLTQACYDQAAAYVETVTGGVAE